ncbi:MAG TPA: ribonuclease HI family protein [Clostridia bacterium]|jgi:ribonuclease HI|nr:ribonuclease HI family protein [Clostridia bacterium]
MRNFTVYCDGASRGNPGEAGIGYIIIDGNGKVLKEESDYLGQATNNVAEYTALVRSLQDSLKLGAKSVQVYSDSELMVKQIKGEYRVKNPGLAPLFQQVSGLIARFDNFKIDHVPREKNKKADSLANKGIDAVLTQE